MRAIRIEAFGGPEVLRLVEDAARPAAGDGELLIEVDAAGVNFADTHARENAYVERYGLPLVPGSEVVGRLADGTRVLALCGVGGYAEYVTAPQAHVFPVPEDVSDGAALALLVQGLTAWHLWRTCARLAGGESVVVHSAAGGVGQLAVQLARPLGAGRVIACASSVEKRALALSLGADVAVDPSVEDLRAALLDANGGEPVDVVVEMAGGPQFDASYAALAPFGRIVVCGIASREQNEIRTGSLLRNSRSVIGFWLFHCLERPAELIAEPLSDLLARVADGSLRVGDGTTYPLSDARRAHEDLVGRRTTGKLLLDPRR